MSEKFQGFVPPTKNYFPMPNEWIDICSKIKSLAEIKVIFYILRHTWGYQEYGITKVISFDEFISGRKRNDGTRMDDGTGLSRQSVIDGLKLAVEDGYIICEVDDADKARIKKAYALKMRSEVKNLDSQISSLNSIPQGSKFYTPGVKEVDSSSLNSTPRSEKDTIETHLEKDTIETHGLGANAPARAHLKADIEETLKQRIDDTLEEVKRASEKLPVVKPDVLEEDETPTVKMGAVKIGATHGPVREAVSSRGSRDMSYSRGSTATRNPAEVPGSTPVVSQQQIGASAHADTPVHSDLSRGHDHRGAGHDRDSLASRLTTSQHTIPKRPRRPVPQEKPQLTLEGANVKEWYEEKRGVKVRMIEKNIKDCNALGEYEEMTRESLHDTIEHLDNLKWVKEHDYAIDLHVLAGDGRLSFESNWPLVKRKRRGKSSTADEYGNDYSLAALANRSSALD